MPRSATSVAPSSRGRDARQSGRDERTRLARSESAPAGQDRPVRADWVGVMEPPPGRGVPGRQTVTITGLGAEGYAARRGTRASTAQRHQAIKRHERAGFRPDRVAMWAVLLGVMLMLAAAASSHAATLAMHHVLSLH